MKFTIYALTAFFLLILFFPAQSNAQRRDYLTEEEVELVRDAQEIDKRVEVLSKAIDRRILVLNNDATQAKQIEKDSGKWGELPKGKRVELLSDIAKLLQKAIDDVDDVARRARESELFPKAVHKLSDAAQKFLPQFNAQLAKQNDEKERGALLTSIDLCNQIIEAAAQIPKELPKDKKKKKDKSTDN